MTSVPPSDASGLSETPAPAESSGAASQAAVPPAQPGWSPAAQTDLQPQPGVAPEPQPQYVYVAPERTPRPAGWAITRAAIVLGAVAAGLTLAGGVLVGAGMGSLGNLTNIAISSSFRLAATAATDPQAAIMSMVNELLNALRLFQGLSIAGIVVLGVGIAVAAAAIVVGHLGVRQAALDGFSPRLPWIGLIGGYAAAAAAVLVYIATLPFLSPYLGLLGSYLPLIEGLFSTYGPLFGGGYGGFTL